MKADLNIDFIGKRKIFYTLSLALITIGILVSVIFGVKLDIQFKGGSIVRYTYSGEIDKSAAQTVATETLKNAHVTTSFSEDVASHTKTIIYNIDEGLSNDVQDSLFSAVSKQFPDNKITKGESNNVSASMGAEALRKAILAVVLASLLIIIYIWIRFRYIGGLPAGLTAFAALVHDVLIVFVVFSVLRIPLNDNFIAVVLTVLGYSINDTIVIYDRVRENKRLYGSKMNFKDTVNKSINQSFARSVNTSLVTAFALLVLTIFSMMYNLNSVTTFALPMLFGVISGTYSTICIAGPLWITWETHKEKKAEAERLQKAQEKEERRLQLEASRQQRNAKKSKKKK